MPEPTTIHDLVDALSDRSITEEQIAQLNALIESDPTARRDYLESMRIEAELGALHQPLASWSFDEAVDSGVSASEPATVRPPASSSRRNDALRFFQLMGTLAATVAISVAGSSWLTLQGVSGRGPLAAWLAEDVSRSDGEVVARVAATRNCRWRGDRSDLGFGAEVAGGQLLELETGLAELKFSDGARLVLEGPAAFRISDAETVEFYRGRVAATIPEDAVGFSLRTPRLVISESGAQYGIVASADGSDEVHVFEGDVRAKAVDRRGNVTGVVTLASLEATTIGAASRRFAVFNADDARFVRSLDTRSEPGEGLLAFDNFSYPGGPLAWQNGGFGWAGPWADLEAAPSPEQAGAPTNGVVRGSIATHEMVSLGNRFVQSGNGNRVRRTLSTSIGGVFDSAGLVENADGVRLIGADGSTVYLSFLQRVSKTDDVFYGVELHRGDGNYNRVLCVGNGADGHGYGVSSNYRPLGGPFASLGEENIDVNLVVVRIDFGADGDDVATVFRNPPSLTNESSCVPTATLRGAFAFDRVSLGNFEGAKVHEIDELRIGTDFRAVTGHASRAGLGAGVASSEPFRLPRRDVRLDSRGNDTRM